MNSFPRFRWVLPSMYWSGRGIFLIHCIFVARFYSIFNVMVDVRPPHKTACLTFHTAYSRWQLCNCCKIYDRNEYGAMIRIPHDKHPSHILKSFFWIKNGWSSTSEFTFQSFCIFSNILLKTGSLLVCHSRSVDVIGETSRSSICISLTFFQGKF